MHCKLVYHGDVLVAFYEEYVMEVAGYYVLLWMGMLQHYALLMYIRIDMSFI